MGIHTHEPDCDGCAELTYSGGQDDYAFDISASSWDGGPAPYTWQWDNIQVNETIDFDTARPGTFATPAQGQSLSMLIHRYLSLYRGLDNDGYTTFPVQLSQPGANVQTFHYESVDLPLKASSDHKMASFHPGGRTLRLQAAAEDLIDIRHKLQMTLSNSSTGERSRQFEAELTFDLRHDVMSVSGQGTQAGQRVCPLSD